MNSPLALPAPIANVFSRFRLHGGLGEGARRDSVAPEDAAARLHEIRDEVSLLGQMDGASSDLDARAGAVSVCDDAKNALGKSWAVDYEAGFSTNGENRQALIHSASTSYDHEYRLVLDGPGATAVVTAVVDMNEIFAEALVPVTDSAGQTSYQREFLFVTDNYSG